MRFHIILFAAATASAATIPAPPAQDQQRIAHSSEIDDANAAAMRPTAIDSDANLDLPNKSGFRNCGSQNDIFPTFDPVVNPPYPKKGDTLTLSLNGTFTRWLNATALIIATHTINRGLDSSHRVYKHRQVFRFCDVVGNIQQPAASFGDADIRMDMGTWSTCPPRVGVATMDLVDVLPQMAPAGTYESRYEAVTEEWDDVFCFEGVLEVEGR